MLWLIYHGRLHSTSEDALDVLFHDRVVVAFIDPVSMECLSPIIVIILNRVFARKSIALEYHIVQYAARQSWKTFLYAAEFPKELFHAEFSLGLGRTKL